ncbi:unnamed protein product [Notodromas monacha]|uniref:tRNA(Ile)-lysidine/2-thiocytidine synthase N-terminal domain-containing protein n=1 Tax=Notodromas monacha TaxID=399045 RepID=A0A7R9BZ88_9CRUS|nr:unnamed protein product [Notodromas monacha]CAG0923180.1 unnamed protein product [Notodromas monacha]
MGSLSLEKGKLVSNRNAEEGLHSPPQSFEACLEEARKIFANASADCSKVSLPDQAVMFRDVDRLRWFMLPSEALEILQRGSRCEIASDVPFVPKSYESYTPRNWVDFVPEIPSVTTANIVQKAMKTAKAELDPKSKSLVNIEDLGRVSNNFDNSPTARNSLVTDNRRKSLEKIVDRQPISNLISTMSLMDVTREEFNDGVQVTSSSVLELNPDDGENNQEESSSLKFERRDSKRIALVSKSVISRGWHTPPKSIYKPTVEAINEFKMLRDGDKVLVCLSGGKDSLSLLHTLHQYQYAASASGVKFLLGAITVDPQSSFYDPSPLIPYLETLGVSYFYEEQGIIEKASQIPDLQSICSFCSRMKRGRLYAAARREGWNVLALGQHLDDLTESFFMSIFHNGRLRTMKAHYAVKENDLRVVRPFVYVREKDLRQFAEYQGLPIIAENCPGCFDAPKERYRIKQMLAQQEVMFPKLFASLLSALHPLMAFGRVGVESKIMGTRFSWKKDGEDANFYFNLDDEEIDAMHEPTQL